MDVAPGSMRYCAKLARARIIPDMPNSFAYLVFFASPLLVYLLFRRLPPAAALGWSLVLGYLLLPTRAGLDLPMVPLIDKDGMPVLTAALMLYLGVGAAVGGRRGRAANLAAPEPVGDPSVRRGRGIINALIVLLFISPVWTVFQNGDPIIAGPVVIHGLQAYDAISVIASFGIALAPFLLARRYFASPESHVLLLKILVLAMIGYSLPILYELRMSPQLNQIFYGFFPHSFEQHVRAGGYRPVVFLPHGLWLSILIAMSALAAATLWRQRMSEGVRAGQWFFAAIYLFVILVLSKSLGALSIVVCLVPVVILLGVRGQLLVAGVLAGIVLLYPMLRGAGWIPVDQVEAIAQSVSAERASSLMFRLDQEDDLLLKAQQRPLVGWGSWGRNHIYDPDTGAILSVTDGAWIIIIGSFGWLGYIAKFGLLTLPIILLALRRKMLEVTPATAGLALVMATNLFDLLPNATLTPMTWLIGGALAGRYAYVARPAVAAAAGGVVAAGPRSWVMVTDVLRPDGGVARRPATSK